MQDGTLHIGEDNSTLVRFITSASRAMRPDTIRITLEVVNRGATLAAAQSATNRQLAAAVDTAKSTDGIKVTTGSPYAYEDRQNGGLWPSAATQSLTLTSGDFETALALAGKLQAADPSLALKGMAFGLSDEARNALNAELLKEAVAQGNAIATTMKDATGAAGMTAVELSPNLDGNSRFGGRAVAMAQSLESASAPVAEPEDLEVSVSLTAVYRLFK